MTQFILEGRDHAARAETDFVLGFIEAMFFTNSEPSVYSDTWFTPEVQKRREEGQISELPGDVGYSDLHPDTLKAIRLFCATWQTEASTLLTQAYATGYEEVQAGRDLSFTMGGHGVGFWDRSLDDLGDQLTEAAGNRECNPCYDDDGFVHVDL